MTYRGGFAGRARVQARDAQPRPVRCALRTTRAGEGLRARSRENDPRRAARTGARIRLDRSPLRRRAPPTASPSSDTPRRQRGPRSTADVLEAVYAFEKAQRLQRTGWPTPHSGAGSPARRRSRPATRYPRATSRSTRRGRSSWSCATEVQRWSRPCRPRGSPATTHRWAGSRSGASHGYDTSPLGPLQADVLLRRVYDPRQPVGAAVSGVARVRPRAEFRRRAALRLASPMAKP